MEALYVDLDGVLADFDRGVLELCGLPPGDPELSMRQMWRSLARAENFFGELELMPDAMELWERCLPHSPTILTGLPHGGWAEPQKRAWCARVLGPEIPVITCMSRDKPQWSAPGHVLIDDRLKAKEPWEAAGGTFILHTSAAASVQALEALLG